MNFCRGFLIAQHCYYLCFVHENQKSGNLTNLSDLGEFGLIRHLTENIVPINQTTIKGVGDDAAVINAEGGQILLSTDLLIAGIHFDLTFTPLKHLGYKAAVVNFSDIAAMNGKPEQITVSLGISNRFSVEDIEELYEGIKFACKKYRVDLIGGDTAASPQGLFISIAVVGRAREQDIVYRNGAKVNDLIFVSGDLGAAYMGLLLLEREKKVFMANPEIQPELSGHDYILQRQLKPEARADIIELLQKCGVKPNSMIDISDGLASELLHICHDSGTGCNIYEEKIPVSPFTAKMAAEFNIPETTAALNGGEDYELLFTVDQKDFNKLKDLKEISVVGHITDISQGSQLVSATGGCIPLTAQGWDAFLRKGTE